MKIPSVDNDSRRYKAANQLLMRIGSRDRLLEQKQKQQQTCTEHPTQADHTETQSPSQPSEKQKKQKKYRRVKKKKYQRKKRKDD
jgi:hypothetical protein